MVGGRRHHAPNRLQSERSPCPIAAAATGLCGPARLRSGANRSTRAGSSCRAAWARFPLSPIKITGSGAVADQSSAPTGGAVDASGRGATLSSSEHGVIR
jgi:hypothetical protein